MINNISLINQINRMTYREISQTLGTKLIENLVEEVSTKRE